MGADGTSALCMCGATDVMELHHDDTGAHMLIGSLSDSWLIDMNGSWPIVGCLPMLGALRRMW